MMKNISTIGSLIIATLSCCGLTVSADIVWSGNMNLKLDYAPFSVSPDDPPTGPHIFELDVNTDGTTDLLINHYRGITLTPTNGCALVNHGEILAQEDVFGNYSLGEVIDSSLAWGTDTENLVYYRYSDAYGDHYNLGPWTIAQKGALGLSFDVDGQTHYGWLRMSNQYGESVIVHDYAYESVTNNGIVAGAIPEPSSIMLLLVGAGGIWMVRGKR